MIIRAIYTITFCGGLLGAMSALRVAGDAKLSLAVKADLQDSRTNVRHRFEMCRSVAALDEVYLVAWVDTNVNRCHSLAGQAVPEPCDGFRVRHSPDSIRVYISSGRVVIQSVWRIAFRVAR